MRFASIYALTVLGPLVALLLVLRAGARLEAPPSVGGTWALEAEGLDADSDRLSVLQSGRVLEVRLAGDVGRGRLSGAELHATVGSWTVVARRDDASRLAGTLTRAAPPASVGFVATLERGPRAGEH